MEVGSQMSDVVRYQGFHPIIALYEPSMATGGSLRKAV